MRNDEQQKIFTLNLNNFIRNTGKTQREIADVIGVSPQTFNTWCQGIALPRMGKIQALADYFGINKSDLIEDRSESPQSSLSSQPAAKSPALRPDESALLALYNQLNSDGQEKVCDLLDDIVSSGKYEIYEGMNPSEVEDPIVLKYDSSLQKVVNDHLKWRKEYSATHEDCVPTKDKETV